MNKTEEKETINSEIKEENIIQDEEIQEEIIEQEECNCKKENNEECKCKNKENSNCKAEPKKEKKGFFKKDNKEIEELNQKIASLQESLLRNQAELQNYKRRKDEETAKILKYKDEDLIKEFLTVLDNFERAIKMDDNDLTDEVSRFLAGFKLIYTNTINILNKFEVKEIDAEGVEFDPEFHHAVLTDHDENKPEGVILEVLQKGYIYKDRIIRPAMVKVNE